MLLGVMLRAAAAASAVVFAGVAAEAQEAWPTTRFEVVAAVPDTEDLGPYFTPDDPAAAVVEIPDSVRDEMEAYLQEVGQILEGQGFRPPDLKVFEGSRPDNAGEPVYRLYLYDYPNGAAGYFDTACFDWRPEFIGIDADPKPTDAVFITDVLEPSVLDGGYKTLAHELFHAVQFGYPFFNEQSWCARGAWISEGTATAVGAYMARQLRGVKAYRNMPDEKLQRRSYRRMLRIASNRLGDNDYDAYGTASFFNYLAELAVFGPRENPPFEDIDPETDRDFTYLHDFFNRPPPEGGASAYDIGFAAEMRWIDDNLRASFNRSLPGVYSDFVTAFASYVPNRADHDRGPASWRRDVFGRCEQATLTPEEPRATFTITFEPISARCVEVETGTGEDVELVVLARNKGPGADVTALAGLHVGVPGTYLIDRSDITLPPSKDRRDREGLIGSWRLPFRAADEALIISNVADVKKDHPENGPIEFQIMHPLWDASIRLTGEAYRSAESDAADPAADPDADAAPNQEKRDARDRAELGLKSVSTHTMNAASVGRAADAPPCPDPFKYLACGPMTRVTLRLAPGTFGDLSATSGRGGFTAQMGGMLEASGRAMLDGDYLSWMEELAETPGNQIQLMFPLIDHGFAGSFDNAYITVQMPDRKVWQSVGPTDAIPGRGTRFPLSGSVTIDAFTEDVMIGSFSAALVDKDDFDSASDNLQQTLPIKHQLSGRFVVAAPALNDRRSEMLDPLSHQDFADDLEVLFPGMSSLDERMAEAARNATSTVPDTARDRTPAATSANLCDCSCNYVESASSVCRAQCEPVHLACAGEPAPVELAPPQADVDARLAELRAKLRPALVDRFGESGAEALLASYDALPETVEARELWIRLQIPGLLEDR